MQNNGGETKEKSSRCGVILKGLSGLYTVYTDGKTYVCKARGILRLENTKPLIGDRVELSEVNTDAGTAVIERIIPRKMSLVRPAVANVSKMILVIAAVSPQPDMLLIDKMLITARMKGLETVLMINKSDQDPEKANEIYEEYRGAARCYVTCIAEGRGFREIIRELDGNVTVLAGQSGVGKSTFLNLASGTDRMQTGGLSDKTMRGKHTTRHAELFRLENPELSEDSFLIDSPGFSMMDIELSPGELQNMYPEMEGALGKCRFQDCSHTGEPGCAVKCLTDEGILPEKRYERYIQFYRELKEKEKNRYR